MDKNLQPLESRPSVLESDKVELWKSATMPLSLLSTLCVCVLCILQVILQTPHQQRPFPRAGASRWDTSLERSLRLVFGVIKMQMFWERSSGRSLLLGLIMIRVTDGCSLIDFSGTPRCPAPRGPPPSVTHQASRGHGNACTPLRAAATSSLLLFCPPPLAPLLPTSSGSSSARLLWLLFCPPSLAPLLATSSGPSSAHLLWLLF
uniref:Uncharacterized protein n=1 Tax=Knipowitschia caucasica TaxID=637954 RepID=A0AAV2KHB7_KNICA